MKKMIIALAFLYLIPLFISSSPASNATSNSMRPAHAWSEDELTDLIDPGLRKLYESASSDTEIIARYYFKDGEQGWMRVDLTVQWDAFFHVDNFAGISPGKYNFLKAIQGKQSMWCGARPDPNNLYLCRWKTVPGYGNNWNQFLVTDPISFTGYITFSFSGAFHSERDVDITYLEYYNEGIEDWKEIRKYSGSEVISDCISGIAAGQSRTKLRFRFTSNDSKSDEDGEFDSHGGAIVDSLRIGDTNHLINYEDFEEAAVNAKDVGIWHSRRGNAFGIYGGVEGNLNSYDPCSPDKEGWLFSLGSTILSAKYPGIPAMPGLLGGLSMQGGIVQDVAGISPWVAVQNILQYEKLAIKGTGYFDCFNTAKLGLGLELKLDPMTTIGAGYEWIYDLKKKESREKFYKLFNLKHFFKAQKEVQNSVDSVRIAIRARDICNEWYRPECSCELDQGPWIYDVCLIGIKGPIRPSWEFRAIDLFQDNFPMTCDIESYIRADAAIDLNSSNNSAIRSGDSIVVSCVSPGGGGIATESGWPAVYMHVKCTYIGAAPAKPNLVGPELAGNYGHYKSNNGDWTIIQGDTARTEFCISDGTYMFDLNDSLFTRGYRVEYYFEALDNAGNTSTLPSYAESNGDFFEFDCLPSLRSDILFVNDFCDVPCVSSSARSYWDQTFKAVLPPPDNLPDRFDVNDAAAGGSNGLGSRAKSCYLTRAYCKIIWDSGDNDWITISDGTVCNGKSNDCQLLIEWMDQHTDGAGLWVCGDDIAYDLESAMGSTVALYLLNNWCGTDYISKSYFDDTGGRLSGGVINPLITGVSGGQFVHLGILDQFYVYGGCPSINWFNTLDCTGTGVRALKYPNHGGNQYWAGIQNSRLNSQNKPVRTMWFGFSFQYVRDDAIGAPIDRFHLAKDVFDWMESITNANIADALSKTNTYRLAQNYPNPFNPTTAIKFDMKDRGIVTLLVYNVAGQLIRTLVNGMKDAGSYTVTWDGKDELGGTVATGIYLYKMSTKNFSQTKKIVLLR